MNTVGGKFKLLSIGILIGNTYDGSLSPEHTVRRMVLQERRKQWRDANRQEDGGLSRQRVCSDWMILPMFGKRKNTYCCNCGFLGWQTTMYAPPLGEGQYTGPPSEFKQRDRVEFQKGKRRGMDKYFDDFERTEYHSKLHCLRAQWDLTGYSDLERGYIDEEALRQPRQCKYYFDYQPSYKPDEHKELKREADTRRIILIASLTGAGIGALAAIIAQLLYAIFSS